MMVEKQELFTKIDNMEEQIGHTYAGFGILKKTIIALIEENQRLHIENQQLRGLLKKSEIEDTHERKGSDALSVGEGYDNLARLYNEGFHICNVYFGHLRTEGECLFCFSFLNK